MRELKYNTKQVWTQEIVHAIVEKIVGVNAPIHYNASHNYVNRTHNSSLLMNRRCEWTIRPVYCICRQAERFQGLTSSHNHPAGISNDSNKCDRFCWILHQKMAFSPTGSADQWLYCLHLENLWISQSSLYIVQKPQHRSDLPIS